ncbi:MAG: mandelate racemase/muconate lactonizing enzyme family protein [Syntrophorhabdaceae bacterium]
MPDDTITGIRTRILSQPLRLTFSTALGHKNTMTSVMVDVYCRDGSQGTGECATSFVLPNEAAGKIREILQQAKPEIIGRSAGEFPALIAGMRQRYNQFPMTVSGLETALFRVFTTQSRKDEINWFGNGLKDIETDITIPFTSDETFLGNWIKRAARNGFTIYKIKVSGQYDEDTRLIDRCTQILSRTGIEYTLRLDGNQGFSVKTFLSFSDWLNNHRFPVELFEQPLRRDDYPGMKEITRFSAIPLILDETVFTRRDLEHAVAEGLGHGVNIKIAKSGIMESLAILDGAQKNNFKIMAGCMTETMTGLSAGIHMAIGTGAFDYIDLDSIHYLKHKNHYGDIGIEGPNYKIIRR